MPYKDPEKRSASNREGGKKWRARFQATDPEGYREYMRRAREKYFANISDERRAEIREYHRQYRLAHRPATKPRKAPAERPAPRVQPTTPEQFYAAPADARHGTVGGYKNYKCRCPRCTTANAAAMREYRDRKRSREGGD